MYITLRPVDPATDYPRLAEIASAANPEGITEENLRNADANRPEGTIHHRMAAVGETGCVCGYYIVQRYPWAKPGEFFHRVMVEPAFRRRGVGTLLADDAVRYVRSQGGTAAVTWVKDDDADSLRFAEGRGLEINVHLFASQLDPESFADDAFAGTVAAAEAQGIRFTTMAELGVTEANIRRLYDLDNVTAQDVPGRGDDPGIPFEEFARNVRTAASFRAEATLIALAGDRWVGFAALSYRQDGETPYFYHQMTGVLREYRGRGIATALKVLCVQTAQKLGVACLKTDNNDINAPMLAINRKMGYQPQAGTYFLKATLA